MSVVDELLASNGGFAANFPGPLPLPPSRKLAVLACMDSRMDVFRILGLKAGEAHVLRNAGGSVSDGELRSLAISQRRLGTREVVLIHHTDCGMVGFDDEDFRKEILAETGVEPTWASVPFADLDDDVRASIARVRDSPFLTRTESVRGFVYDVATGRLREVT